MLQWQWNASSRMQSRDGTGTQLIRPAVVRAAAQQSGARWKPLGHTQNALTSQSAGGNLQRVLRMEGH